jgi:aspartate 1-decarboxylase
MFIKVLRSKIHRATVTAAEIDYVGSITIDAALRKEAGLVLGDCVLIADLTNGKRFETYVIDGQPGSGEICINGAAARLVNIQDEIIVMAWAYLTPDEAQTFKPTIVLVDEANKVTKIV